MIKYRNSNWKTTYLQL